MKHLITSLIIIILLLSHGKTVIAQGFLTNSELKQLGFTIYESVNTDSPNYFFKRAWEEIKLRFLYRDKKSQVKYLSELLDIRFKEVVYMINNNQTGVFENTISRYNSLAGKILDNSKDRDTNLSAKVKNYLPLLEKLRDMYPANSSYWIMTQEAIDTTKRL